MEMKIGLTLSIYLSICLSTYLSIYLSVFRDVEEEETGEGGADGDEDWIDIIHLNIYLVSSDPSILSVCLVSLYIYLSIYLSMLEM